MYCTGNVCGHGLLLMQIFLFPFSLVLPNMSIIPTQPSASYGKLPKKSGKQDTDGLPYNNNAITNHMTSL